MFPATVLVAALCGFHVGTVLTVSGVGTIVALLLAKWRIGKFIPLFYGSSFSYIAAYLAIAQQMTGSLPQFGVPVPDECHQHNAGGHCRDRSLQHPYRPGDPGTRQGKDRYGAAAHRDRFSGCHYRLRSGVRGPWANGKRQFSGGVRHFAGDNHVFGIPAESGAFSE